MVRAHESRRADRLFNDPYAVAFLMAAPGAFDMEQRAAEAGAGDMALWGATLWSHAVIRTRFFDDYLLDATARGIRQVVLLAAGLDTRGLWHQAGSRRRIGSLSLRGTRGWHPTRPCHRLPPRLRAAPY